MNAASHNRALTFLRSLGHLSATDQHNAFINEVLETHGQLDAPDATRSHLWELDLHGICATGATEEEAIANWKRLASKTMPHDDTEDDGFVTVHPIPHQIAGGAA